MLSVLDPESTAVSGSPLAVTEHTGITFLITDLVSSTSLWEEHPEAMRLALATHDQIVRRTIDGHGGTVFKGTGDGFCATFTDPCAALGAAIDIHETMQSQTWGE